MPKVVAVFLIASELAVACKNDCIPWEGVCACNAPGFVLFQPGDERVPDDKMPSWEREGVHADTPGNLIEEDIRRAEEERDATRQGKEAAGIPQ